jgi:hypothetical protein
MQKGAGGKAGTPDISGIPMYFRSYQNNVAFQLLTLAILGIFMHLGDNHKFRGYEDQLYPSAAIWTVFKISIQRSFTKMTGFGRIAGLLRKIRAKFRNRLFAAIAHDKRITLFNPQ